MPARYLARKMDVESSTIKRYEDAEARGAISLKTLQRVAAALDCDLKYALVPKKTLPQAIQDQALLIAQEQLNAAAHTMTLKDQTTSLAEKELQMQEQAQALLNGSWRQLWRCLTDCNDSVTSDIDRGTLNSILKQAGLKE